MIDDAMAYLDGNAAAGELRELFAVDVTCALGECGGCGRKAVLAEAHVYMRAPGLVARCAACQRSLLRVVKGPGRTWLDLRGLVSLEFETLNESPPAREEETPARASAGK
jgi:Family of unknown function (DUF6510)